MLEIVRFSPNVTVTDDVEIVQGPVELLLIQFWLIVTSEVIEVCPIPFKLKRSKRINNLVSLMSNSIL